MNSLKSLGTLKLPVTFSFGIMHRSQTNLFNPGRPRFVSTDNSLYGKLQLYFLDSFSVGPEFSYNLMTGQKQFMLYYDLLDSKLARVMQESPKKYEFIFKPIPEFRFVHSLQNGPYPKLEARIGAAWGGYYIFSVDGSSTPSSSASLSTRNREPKVSVPVPQARESSPATNLTPFFWLGTSFSLLGLLAGILFLLKSSASNWKISRQKD